MGNLDIQNRFIEDLSISADYETVASKYRAIFEKNFTGCR